MADWSGWREVIVEEELDSSSSTATHSLKDVFIFLLSFMLVFYITSFKNMLNTKSVSWNKTQTTSEILYDFSPRCWNSGTQKVTLCLWMSPKLPASRAVACTTWSPADAQGGSSKNRRPSVSTSVSRSSVEQVWRSPQGTATPHSGRLVFLSSA